MLSIYNTYKRERTVISNTSPHLAEMDDSRLTGRTDQARIILSHQKEKQTYVTGESCLKNTEDNLRRSALVPSKGTI